MSLRTLTLPVLLTGTFMGFLDLFLVIVAVPSIAAGLHAGVATTQLVLSMYVVTYGAALVIGGRLGDRFGRRRAFAWGMAAFTVTSAGCAVAPSIAVLIVMRALQGVAGAAMLPQVLATIQAAYAGEARRRAMLAYTTTLGCAGAFGQVIGGGLLTLDVLHLGWRTLFLVNIPVGLVSLVLVPRAVPDTRAPRAEAIDVRGAVLLSAALALLLLALGTGPNDGWPPVAWLMLAVGAALGVALPAVERRRPTPLLPPALLAQSSLRWGLAATFAFYAANNVVFIGLTLFIQDGLHISALGAGAAYLPLGVAYLAVTLAGRSQRAPHGARAMLLGTPAMGAGLAATVAAALLAAGPVAIALTLVIFGAGLGLVYPAVVATVLARVRPGEEGAATGVLLTTTQVSNALGIAIAAAAWSATASTATADRLVVELLIAGVLLIGVGGAALRLRGQAAGNGAHGLTVSRAAQT